MLAATALTETEAPSQRSISIAGGFVFFLATSFVANAVHLVYDGVRGGYAPQWMYVGSLGLLSAVAVLWLAQNPRRALRIARDLRFGVALLGTLALATMVGTVVLQGVDAEQLARKYGRLAVLFELSHIDDLFHSFWFGWLLVLLATTQVALVTRRKVWRWPDIGLVGAHGGTLVLLAGAAIGALTLQKGMVHLNIGEETSTMEVGQRGEKKLDLPFTVRLDDFEIARRKPELRLYVMQVDGEHWRTIQAIDATTPGTHAVKGFGNVEVSAYEPHPDPETRVVPAGKGQGNPALKLDVMGQDGWLFAGDPKQSFVRYPARDLTVRFSWEPVQPRKGKERHMLGAEGSEPKEVSAGGEVELGGRRYRVTNVYADFRYDVGSKRAFSASGHPNNPAVAVQPLDASGKPDGPEQFVFASGTSMGHGTMGHGAMGEGAARAQLTYSFVPGADKGWTVTFVGSTGQAVVTVDGEERQSEPFRKDTSTAVNGVRISVLELLPAAKLEEVKPGPDTPPRNPAVTLKLDGGLPIVLREREGRQAVRLNDELAIQFARKADDIKQYTSTVSLHVEGDVLASQKVSVNHPLKWGSYMIYQSNYNPENPRYAGLLVVRDPGLPLVYAGLVMMMIGVAVVLFFRRRGSMHAPAESKKEVAR